MEDCRCLHRLGGMSTTQRKESHVFDDEQISGQVEENEARTDQGAEDAPETEAHSFEMDADNEGEGEGYFARK